MKFEIDTKLAKSMSRIGPRAAYGSIMYGFVRDGFDFLTMSADLGRSSGLERLRKEFPDRFYNVGIAEQSMVAIAAGMAREGETIFASSFAPFISMRASEHVRVNLSYMCEPVKLVGLGSGFSLGFLGNTHYGLEDYGIMNALPNLTILCPADAASVGKTILAAVETDGPVYIRLTGEAGSSNVYDQDYDLIVGKLNPVKIWQDSEIAIIGCGAILSECLQASHSLVERGIFADVFDCHTIKPFDSEGACRLFARYSLVVSVEEHFLNGGLHSILSQVKVTYDCPGCLRGLGVGDSWVSPGERSYVLDQLGLNSQAIADRVKRYFEEMECRCD